MTLDRSELLCLWVDAVQYVDRILENLTSLGDLLDNVTVLVRLETFTLVIG